MKSFTRKRTGLMMVGILALIMTPVVIFFAVYFTRDNQPPTTGEDIVYYTGEYTVYDYIFTTGTLSEGDAVLVEELENGEKIYKIYPAKFEITKDSWQMTISETHEGLAGTILGTNEGNGMIISELFGEELAESFNIETTWEAYKEFMIFCCEFNDVNNANNSLVLCLIGQIQGEEVIIQMLHVGNDSPGTPGHIAGSSEEAKSMIDEFITNGYTKLYEYFWCGNVA